MRAQPQVMGVDDDMGICHLLRSFLSERGYQAVTVANAEDALERYHADRPAAVILNVASPGRMDGDQLQSAVVQNQRERSG